MKKSLFSILTLLSVLVFISCSSSDNEDSTNGSLLGKWFETNKVETVELTFNPNGEVVENTVSKQFGTIAESIGTYTVSGNVIKFKWTKSRNFNKEKNTWEAYFDNKEDIDIVFAIRDGNLHYLNGKGETTALFTRKQ